MCLNRSPEPRSHAAADASQSIRGGSLRSYANPDVPGASVARLHFSAIQASVRLATRRYGGAGQLEPSVRVNASGPRQPRRAARLAQRARTRGRIFAVLMLALSIAITVAIVRQLA
jgi:hypothetical protein